MQDSIKIYNCHGQLPMPCTDGDIETLWWIKLSKYRMMAMIYTRDDENSSSI